MRALLWCACACVLGAALACGETENDPDQPSAGSAAVGGSDAAGSSSVAGQAQSGGGGAGGSTTQTSAGASAGGSAGASSGGRSSGGTSEQSAGTSGTAAGAAGEGTAGSSSGSACEGRYDECGCGCCRPEPQDYRCYYPGLGDDLDEIAEADRQRAMDPSCANSGCWARVRRVCCSANDAGAGEAEYVVSGYPGGLDHVTIHRTSADGHCSTLDLVHPQQQSPEQFRISLPAGWAVAQTRHNLCTQSSIRTAFGGSGEIRWRGPYECALDFDFTLFVLAEDGSVEAVRFKGENYAISDLGNPACR